MSCVPTKRAQGVHNVNTTLRDCPPLFVRLAQHLPEHAFDPTLLELGGVYFVKNLKNISLNPGANKVRGVWKTVPHLFLEFIKRVDPSTWTTANIRDIFDNVVCRAEFSQHPEDDARQIVRFLLKKRRPDTTVIPRLTRLLVSDVECIGQVFRCIGSAHGWRYDGMRRAMTEMFALGLTPECYETILHYSDGWAGRDKLIRHTIDLLTSEHIEVLFASQHTDIQHIVQKGRSFVRRAMELGVVSPIIDVVMQSHMCSRTITGKETAYMYIAYHNRVHGGPLIIHPGAGRQFQEQPKQFARLLEREGVQLSEENHKWILACFKSMHWHFLVPHFPEVFENKPLTLSIFADLIRELPDVSRITTTLSALKLPKRKSGSYAKAVLKNSACEEWRSGLLGFLIDAGFPVVGIPLSWVRSLTTPEFVVKYGEKFDQDALPPTLRARIMCALAKECSFDDICRDTPLDAKELAAIVRDPLRLEPNLFEVFSKIPITPATPLFGKVLRAIVDYKRTEAAKGVFANEGVPEWIKDVLCDFLGIRSHVGFMANDIFRG